MSLLPLNITTKLDSNQVNVPLSLIGIGYLEAVNFVNNCYIARFKLLPCYNAEGRIKDEVRLDCLVKKEELQSSFDVLDYHRNAGCSIRMKFIANYHEVSSTFSTMTKDDPEQLINIKATLSHVLESYIDDVRYIHHILQTANG